MTPPDPPVSPTSGALAEAQRHELQGLLGEYHGLLTTVIQRLPEEGELRELYADIRNAFPGVSFSFGQVQAQLNTGDHDERISDVALAAGQLEPKRRGFRFNCGRFYSAIKDVPNKFELRDVRHALRAVKWGNIIVGSLSIELDKYKGVEAIKEFGEVVVNVLEEFKEHLEQKDADSPGRAR
jgi:hypothetical protein